VFWLKSEPILEKIPTLTFSPPPQAASQRESYFAGQPKTAKNVRRNGTAKIFNHCRNLTKISPKFKGRDVPKNKTLTLN